MKKYVSRNKFTALVTIVALTSVLAACGGGGNPSAPADTNAAGKGGDSKIPNADWAEKVGLNKTETVDELYQKAKEEGKVVVYSQSSRIKDVKATFEAKYPGITVEAYNLTTNDIVEKVIREQGAKVYNADVAFVKDAAGTVSNEVLQKGYVQPYKPADIMSKMRDQFKNSPGLVPYISMRAVYYNTDAYKTPPISNWWDLTTPEWKGKFILEDPIQSADTMDLFLAIIEHPDDMKAAYKEKFGKDIELSGTENASYEFFKRVLKNDPILMKNSDEAVEAVGGKGQANPPIAVSASSKQRDIAEKKLHITTTYDVKPKMSVAGVNYLYIINQAPHPNAGKLLIRWMAGEADGKAEGFKPFDVLGSWSARTDMGRTDQVGLDKVNMWTYDSDFFYDNFNKFRDFWLKNQ